MHMVENAFNVLVNEGFLREQQGVQTLEAVQKFYEIINESMGRATMVKKDLMDLSKKHSLQYKDSMGYLRYTFLDQAVITLVLTDSATNKEYFHAVRVSKLSNKIFKV